VYALRAAGQGALTGTEEGGKKQISKEGNNEIIKQIMKKMKEINKQTKKKWDIERRKKTKQEREKEA
jgi:hypothetical protein